MPWVLICRPGPKGRLAQIVSRRRGLVVKRSKGPPTSSKDELAYPDADDLGAFDFAPGNDAIGAAAVEHAALIDLQHDWVMDPAAPQNRHQQQPDSYADPPNNQRSRGHRVPHQEPQPDADKGDGENGPRHPFWIMATPDQVHFPNTSTPISPPVVNQARFMP